MLAKLNALGDRMLSTVLPTATAQAVCKGRWMGRFGDCNFYCYAINMNHTQQLRYCVGDGLGCVHLCYDCC
ncbi:hypothetical protein [Streptomyces sp. SID13031]|uniref:hypothetical protein n=1 Tax=Streptomyces sp. SID13031 TaxID=2706046 RepID=UPI0013C8D0CA|nr:hypothetical protein [Streptomyces sp. SID13031]NEA31264.1 hypothetical protein [Streptomyces sp. SID13031]